MLQAEYYVVESENNNNNPLFTLDQTSVRTGQVMKLIPIRLCKHNDLFA